MLSPLLLQCIFGQNAHKEIHNALRFVHLSSFGHVGDDDHYEGGTSILRSHGVGGINNLA